MRYGEGGERECVCVCSFPGVQKPVEEYGSAAAAGGATNGPTAPAKKDEDDFDLFGSDDEEDEVSHSHTHILSFTHTHSVSPSLSHTHTPLHRNHQRSQ